MTAKTYPSRIECPSDVCGHQEAILREGLYYQCLNKPDPDTGARPHGHSVPPVAFVSGRCAGVLTGRSVFTRYCGKNARHEEGDVGGAAFYANGALNAVDSLLDKQPRIDDIRPCTHCVATGRDDAGAPCFICQGKGERVLGSPWPDPKTGLPAEASDE